MSIHFGNVNTVKIDCQQIDCHCGACARMVARASHTHIFTHKMIAGISHSRNVTVQNETTINSENFLLFFLNLR